MKLDLPETARSGELFGVMGYLENSGEPLADAPVAFVLEAFGQFWFWPTWRHFAPPDSGGIDYRCMDVPLGSAPVEVLPSFIVPSLAAPVDGEFFGAILTTNLDEILGIYCDRPFSLQP